MSMVLLRFSDELTINRVLFFELGKNNDSLVHFIAYYNTLSLLS